MSIEQTRSEARLPATTLEALRLIPWLVGISPETQARLAGQAMLHIMPAGAQLFEQAEVPAFAQFLLSGSVELLAVRDDEETLIELVQPFDLILPAAVLSREPYLVRARVQSAAQLLLVSAEALRQDVAEDHDLCLAVLACQAAQFRRQMKLAKSVRLRSAEERIGAWLVALCQASPEAGLARLPVEKRLIASQLGMTRETFSRALPGMARHGLQVVGDIVRFSDLADARAAFSFDPLIDGPEPIRPLTRTRTV